jgi:hypothetical protein
MKKLISELSSLGWTLAGTGLVLITLSGDTKKWGIIISLVALAVHFIGIIVNLGSSED